VIDGFSRELTSDRIWKSFFIWFLYLQSNFEFDVRPIRSESLARTVTAL
jgi:hypothetical protein